MLACSLADYGAFRQQKESGARALNFGRFLRADLIKLDLNIEYTPPEEEEIINAEVEAWKQKELVVHELVKLFERSNEIRNPTKFLKDFIFRERQASTGLGHGLAIPHLRSMQARKVVTLFARSTEGLEFLSVDKSPVHIFFGVTSPPYDDEFYLQIFQWIARAFTDQTWLYETLMVLDDPDEIIRTLRSVG